VGCGSAMISYTVAREYMSAAIGPCTQHVGAGLGVGKDERRPWVGLRPKTEQFDAGMRILPPASPARAMGIKPTATA
jgi:hypothetical protein